MNARSIAGWAALISGGLLVVAIATATLFAGTGANAGTSPFGWMGGSSGYAFGMGGMMGGGMGGMMGFGNSAPAPSAVPGATEVPARGDTVNVTLTEMKIAVDRNGIPAGPVTFVVKNNGAFVHELVVLQTDVPHDKLAADPAQAGKVVETGSLGETGDMKPGESKTFSVTLPAGHYVLICNQIGHYASGMHIAFTVN